MRISFIAWATSGDVPILDIRYDAVDQRSGFFVKIHSNM